VIDGMPLLLEPSDSNERVVTAPKVPASEPSVNAGVCSIVTLHRRPIEAGPVGYVRVTASSGRRLQRASVCPQLAMRLAGY
jgi:hypothetical protein